MKAIFNTNEIKKVFPTVNHVRETELEKTLNILLTYTTEGHYDFDEVANIAMREQVKVPV